jgi:hypothetical protein
MKRLCLALAVVALLLFVTGVGTATAAPPVVQDSGQLAGSNQDAGAAAGTAQDEPSNSNTSVRVLSPGDEGGVSQTNEATSNATATNLNATDQSADQSQTGGGGLQVIGQKAENEQDAFGLATTIQEGASNQNAPVRVLSENEDDGGDVTQENIASSDADATNLNAADQTADQTQSGSDCKCGSDGTQLIGQEADSDQKAAALAATKQEKPSNTNISVRVLSPGDDGDVSQTNEATSDATAGNLNATEQTATQEQSGDCKCGHGGDQAIAQSADSDQKAAALAATKQEKPSNKNISIRVLSDGDDGDVMQVNDASSNATAGNLNVTKQDADQTQAGGSGDQTIAQSADNDQKAIAGALTVQEKPSNTNISVRVLSPGNGGSVTQKNTASSNAEAGNLKITKQTADQTQTGDACGCKHGGEQLIAQSAKSEQDAVALSATIQEKPSNTNTPIRVLSKGDDGDVEQKNDASSDAEAVNLNGTHQTATQSQGGGSGLQAIGQEAKNDQDAFALGLTVQHGASNENAPVRVLSKGDDGDVEQKNDASSDATAANLSSTEQTGTQTQTGDSCKCKSGGEQIIAQSAKNDQEAAALAATFQVKPSNENSPVRVLSKGDGGDVEQKNDASSDATAANLNGTEQTATQRQAGDSCRCGSGTQLIAQSADSDQDAAAIAATFQIKPSNTNEPTRVLSKGDDGDVEQKNEASSNAEAGNLNSTKQAATQAQSGPGLQVIAQAAKNEQDAFALGLTFQIGASNENAPVRVLSKGDGGDVTQTNKATSDAASGNVNWTDQHAAQTQGGPAAHGCCGTGIQAVGQLAKNHQGAVALAATVQLGSKQPCVCGEKGSIGNSNEPTRVSSPGDDGEVDQKNIATSSALASNWNVAKQHVQEIQAAPCLCKDDGIQAVGQLDDSTQFAVAAAAGLQLHPKNASKPDRKESPGYTGGLSQFGKKNVRDASGNSSESDRSKRKIQR